MRRDYVSTFELWRRCVSPHKIFTSHSKSNLISYQFMDNLFKFYLSLYWLYLHPGINTRFKIQFFLFNGRATRRLLKSFVATRKWKKYYYVIFKNLSSSSETKEKIDPDILFRSNSNLMCSLSEFSGVQSPPSHLHFFVSFPFGGWLFKVVDQNTHIDNVGCTHANSHLKCGNASNTIKQTHLQQKPFANRSFCMHV